MWSESGSCSVISTLCDPMVSVHGILQARILGSLSLLQGIFPTQGSNPGLMHCRQIPYHLTHQGNPRILEWAAFPFSRGSSQLRDQTQVSCIAGRFLTIWPTRETQEYWSGQPFPSPGDLPNPGIKPRSPALQADSLPSNPPGKPKNTGVGSLSLFQGIFPTQRWNPGLPHCRKILYPLSHRGSLCEVNWCLNVLFKEFLFIYFWLYWVFLPAKAFSSRVGVVSRGSHFGVFSSCRPQARGYLGTWASVVVHPGLLVTRHVGSFWIRDANRVSCIGRHIHHCTTREPPRPLHWCLNILKVTFPLANHSFQYSVI